MACLTHENVRFDRIKKLEYVLVLNRIRNEVRLLERMEMSRGLLGNGPEVGAGHLPAAPVVHQEYE